VLDLTNQVDLSRVGLTEEDLASDDHAACREVGAAVDWLEHDGLLVPSARSDAFTLVIYQEYRAPEARFAFGEGEVFL
jgi:RES domain-containing protein